MDPDTVLATISTSRHRPSSVCATCAQLVQNLSPPLPTNRILAEWTTFSLISTTRTCPVCQFVYGSISRDPRVEENLERSLYLDVSTSKQEPGCRMLFHYGSHSGCSGSVVSRHELLAESDGSVAGLLLGAQMHLVTPITGRPMPDTVDWARLRQWIRYCKERHEHTGPASDIFHGPGSASRPWASHFRLIDVEKQCIVRGDFSWEYAALSYVWGNSNPVRLNTGNAELFVGAGGLRQCDLPNAFRDAICIAKNLHFRYLWIDALCIRHDDKQDLNHQINGMDWIYRQATATIVSLTCNADTEIPGLRPGCRRNSTPLTLDIGDYHLLCAGPPLEDAVKDSEWETRGWTLQEKVFSTRLLFFTHHQVYYQCADAIWAEDVATEPRDFSRAASPAASHVDQAPVPREPLVRAGRNPVLRPSAEPSSDLEPSPGTRMLGFLQYQDLLQEYITRNLTSGTDILAAFTGILRSLEPRLGASIFGLPRAIFDAALLWRGDWTAARNSHLIEAHGSAFPSWSWSGWDLKSAGGKISWLVVADSHDEADDPWTYAEKTGGAPRTITITEFYRKGSMSIPIPRFLEDASSVFSSTVQNRILTFDACTFWDPEIVLEDIDAISLLNKYVGSRRWVQGSYSAWSDETNTLELVVMSGSRVKDTWFKRRNGTSSLPGAPRQLRVPALGESARKSQPHLVPPQNLWSPTYRRGINQEDDGNEEENDLHDEPIMSVNLMLIVTGPRIDMSDKDVSQRLWVFSTTSLGPSRLKSMTRRVIRLA